MTSLLNSHSLLIAPEKSNLELQILGGYPLQGEVRISGAKNSALVVTAGALLCPDDCCIRHVPSLLDMTWMGQILSSLGVKWEKHGDVLDINASHISQSAAPSELVGRLRASFFLIGPLLARLGVAQVPLPGGCAIGARPVELHIRGLQAMGADVQIKQGIVHACISGNKRRLQGARIYLDFPSVGATETLIMAATLAEGETMIQNAAQEPEVVDLANFCRTMGAKIQGAGTKTIAISGVPSLHSAEYSIIPDRIEAGTFLLAGAITHSQLSVAPVNPQHLIGVIDTLRALGAAIFADASNRLRIVPKQQHVAIAIETAPYPGFPTDLQAQLMAILALSQGSSIISETIFENRLQHVTELNRMGADIRVRRSHAIIRGVSQLTGTEVVGTDLRASAALALAGLAADGITSLKGLHHLDRGYENFEQKLQQVGAKIQRVQSQAESGKEPVFSTLHG
ncbi:MAG: UDP-N-acetylglucosamine 1-carboxyvinyltransferase [Chroococcidiopsidaceae cyanobacterium CP_BM_ER_R8_30]|nr:UDP-N-acetylglucosamine 1-carboxyvinyltransferase [Chroococcidiopsidaceae cyanobacterium CP_BM_ER_R8_30]